MSCPLSARYRYPPRKTRLPGPWSRAAVALPASPENPSSPVPATAVNSADSGAVTTIGPGTHPAAMAATTRSPPPGARPISRHDLDHGENLLIAEVEIVCVLRVPL